MGLPDAYVRLANGFTHAKPGFEGSIMGGVGGTIGEFEIDVVVQRYAR